MTNNKNFEQEKSDFLDRLQPCDLRNSDSFNQAGEIIDKINESCKRKSLNQIETEKFIQKAAANFLREDSALLKEFTNLSKIYLK